MFVFLRGVFVCICCGVFMCAFVFLNYYVYFWCIYQFWLFTHSLIFSDGSKYDGMWKQNHRHGKGTLALANGDRYVGAFKYGKVRK